MTMSDSTLTSLPGCPINGVHFRYAAFFQFSHTLLSTIAPAVDEIEKRVVKAYARIDEHSTQHNNLFIAYFDLKRAGGVS